MTFADFYTKPQYHSKNFLLCDATQSAVMPQYVVWLSVRDIQVPWSHKLEYFENNFTAH